MFLYWVINVTVANTPGYPEAKNLNHQFAPNAKALIGIGPRVTNALK